MKACNSSRRESTLLSTLGLLILATFLLSFLNIQPLTAQGVIGNAIRNKVKQKVEQKVIEEIETAGEEAEEPEAEEPTEPEEAVEPSETEEKPEGSQSNKPAKQKIEAKTQYDFVPGDKLLFYDDFSSDAVGDFPALWTTTGTGEIKTLNVAPGNWLHMTAIDQVYNLMKDLDLPENFILEFDMIPQPIEEDNQFSIYMTLFNGSGDFLDEDLYPGTTGVHITITDQAWQVRGYHNEKEKMYDGETKLAPVENDVLSHVIVWVQKQRLRIYHKNQKVVDLPTIMYTPTNFNRLRFSLWGCEGNPFVSNVRFTSASPDSRSKLITEGKLVSYGIYFDVNSDKIKPESRGAVNDIAKVLNENPDVRIRIDGHTDSDGDDAKNLDLSKRRAASVKTMLTTDFAIATDRIETDGSGETKPVAPNATIEGKAQNRRVEFIKL